MARSPSVAKQPSLRRRVSRQVREETSPITYTGGESIRNGTHGTEYPTAQAPPTPRTELPRLAEQPADGYPSTAKPPQQAPPPPPPRPEKVRTESRSQGQEQSRAYTPEQYYTNGNAYIPADPRTSASPGVDAANYVQAAARRQQRHISGRA